MTWGPDELLVERDRARELLASTEAQVAGLIRERDEWKAACQGAGIPNWWKQDMDDLRARLEASEWSEKKWRDTIGMEHEALLASDRGAAAMWEALAFVESELDTGEEDKYPDLAEVLARVHAALASPAGTGFVPRAELEESESVVVALNSTIDGAAERLSDLESIACAAAFDCGRAEYERDSLRKALMSLGYRKPDEGTPR